MDVKGRWWMWREGGGCEGRVVEVEGGRWMLREGGGYGGRVDVDCGERMDVGGRVVDVEGGWWMWRKGGCGERIDVEGECGGRVVDVKGGWWMWREVTPVLLVLHSLPSLYLGYSFYEPY